MRDHRFQISTTKGGALTLGAIGMGLLIANVFTTSRNDHVGLLGIPFICASAVLWVRSMLCSMAERERNAFDLGKDSVRSIR